jgi:hypothetical protein
MDLSTTYRTRNRRFTWYSHLPKNWVALWNTASQATGMRSRVFRNHYETPNNLLTSDNQSCNSTHQLSCWYITAWNMSLESLLQHIFEQNLFESFLRPSRSRQDVQRFFRKIFERRGTQLCEKMLLMSASKGGSFKLFRWATRLSSVLPVRNSSCRFDPFTWPKNLYTTAYQLQTNARCERANSCVERCIRRNWTRLGYRTSVVQRLGLSPFSLVYGREPAYLSMCFKEPGSARKQTFQSIIYDSLHVCASFTTSLYEIKQRQTLEQKATMMMLSLFNPVIRSFCLHRSYNNDLGVESVSKT